MASSVGGKGTPGKESAGGKGLAAGPMPDLAVRLQTAFYSILYNFITFFINFT